MAKRAKTIDLLRVVDLLQEHITPALCRTVFGAVRKTERQRVWTLEALIRFWTAVVLRAPKALSQALVDSLEGRDPTFPRIEASPEAFFQRCRDLRPAFFAEVFQRFTTRLVRAVPPRYAAEVAPVRARFTAIVILDGSRLAAIAHRLDRKSTRLNSSHANTSYAVFCLKKKPCGSMRKYKLTRPKSRPRMW